MLLEILLNYLPRRGNSLGMESEFTLQGRRIEAADLVWLQNWIDQNPEWSRKQIARELCQSWAWVDGRGRLKDFAARSLLLKLEARGQVKLPTLRVNYRRARPKAPGASRSWRWFLPLFPRREERAGERRPVSSARLPLSPTLSPSDGEREKPPAHYGPTNNFGMHGKAPSLERWEEPPGWTASLVEISPVRLEKIEAGSPAAKRWAYYLERYHYLGFRVVGENLGYLARDRQEREVGCLLFGAAAWRCAARDRRLGWSSQERQKQLSRVVNHTRFLILPWVRVKHLASCLLGEVARRIDGDWRQSYGHGVDWLETFVDRDQFRGSCYRAANWECVGQTQGRSRQDRDHQLRVPVKDVYLYDLKSRRRR